MKALDLALAVALATGAHAVAAQTTWKAHCTNIGPGIPEALADGSVLIIGTASCIVDGGPLDGAVVTQNVLWENSHGTSTLVSGDSVVRKPGSIAAIRNTSGTLKTIVKEGKPAGWEGSGTSLWVTGSGAGAAMKGKTIHWTARATGPRTYVVDNRVD